MAQEEAKDTANNEAAAPSQKNPLVAVLLVVNIIGMATIAFFQYKFMKMESQRPDLTALLKQSQDGGASGVIGEENAPTEEIKKENLFELETFTVNLAQGDGPRRFVRLNAVLKLNDSAELTEIEARKPQIRDTIINILNAKRPEDLLKREGKFNLKEEIKAAVNSYLVDGKVVDIFYVGFQIN